MTPRLDGLGEELPPNRARRAVELVAYLALHQPDVITSDRLRTRVLGSSDADAAAKTLFNTAYAARRAMGGDERRRPRCSPRATRNGLYQLSPEVTVDVHRAATLAAEAKTQTDAQLAMAHYRAALDLVEGEPLANALSGYSWWEAEGHGARIAAVLVDAACSPGRAGRRRRACSTSARWGLERARLVEPYSEALSRAAMELAAAEGDADRLRLEWRECQRACRCARSGQLALAAHRDALRRAQPAGARRRDARHESARTRAAGASHRRPALVRPHDVLEPRHPAALDRARRPPGPSAAQQRDRSVHVVDPGRAVEVGLVADHLDPELLGQRGQSAGARRRSPRRARP